MNRTIIIIVLILVALVSVTLTFFYGCEDDWCYITSWQKISAVDSFERCATLGFPVMESYPRQCRAGGKLFIENLSSGTSYKDKINVTSPLPNGLVQSPLKVSGSARGTWYFEASFPVRIFDANGKELGVVPAQAKSDWMTVEFVPFEATLIFQTPTTETGTLVLEKDNPSGLPENDDSVSIPIRFTNINNNPVACTMEAKLCPDGSYVGRTGPKCEFAPCPGEVGASGISGSVLLGPTCPVMRDPPNPECADRPYSVKLVLTASGSTKIIKEFSSDSNGKFSIQVSPGSYIISQAATTNMLPRCGNTNNILVSAGKYTNTTVYCDTGIR